MKPTVTRHYKALTKRALVELIAKTAPVEAKRFRIAQHLEPDGWLVQFGQGDERLGFFSIEALQKALGLWIEPTRKPKEDEKSEEIAKQLVEGIVASKMSQRYRGKTGFVPLS